MASKSTSGKFTVENLLVAGTIVLLPFIKTAKETLIDFELLPKQLFVGIVGIALLAMLIKNKEKFQIINWATAAFLLFVVANVISITSAINTAEAWGTISRTFVFTSLFFGLIMGFLNKKLDMVFIAKSGVVFGATVGLMSLVHITKAYQAKDVVNALYGLNEIYVHKNFLASALLLGLPLTLFTAFKNEKYWGLAAKITLGVVLLDIVLLRTRSVWLALTISSVVMLVIYLFSSKNKTKQVKWLKYFGIGTAGFVALLFFVINATNISESTFDSGSLDKRTKYWKASWEMYKESPVTGIGAGNWRINFPKHGLSGIDKTVVAGQTTINRPHNDLLWILSETGIIGFLGFVLFIKITFWYLIKVTLSNKDSDSKALALLSIFGMISFVIYGLFEFPLERPDQFFFFLLYAAWGISAYLKQNNPSSKLISTQLLAGSFLVVSIFGSYIIYERLSSAKEAKLAVNDYGKRNGRGMITHGENAQSKYYSLEDFGNPVDFFVGIGKLTNNKLPAAQLNFEDALEAHPYHILTLIQLGNLRKQAKEYDAALGYYNRILEFAPTNQSALLNSAEVYVIQKDFFLALKSLNKVTPNRNNKKYVGLLKVALVNLVQNPPQNKLTQVQKAIAGANSPDELAEKYIKFKQSKINKTKSAKKK